MGFWKALGRMAQGKPVFEVPTESIPSQPTTSASDQAAADPLHDARGNKIIPTIKIEHCKTHHLGAAIEVRAWVVNTSATEIELEKIEMLGQDHNVDRRLSPGRSHEVILYKGPAPTHDNEHDAWIHYKITANGDYFRADYRIEYNQESDGTYSVETLHPENYGVRDL